MNRAHIYKIKYSKIATYKATIEHTYRMFWHFCMTGNHRQTYRYARKVVKLIIEVYEYFIIKPKAAINVREEKIRKHRKALMSLNPSFSRTRQLTINLEQLLFIHRIKTELDYKIGKSDLLLFTRLLCETIEVMKHKGPYRIWQNYEVQLYFAGLLFSTQVGMDLSDFSLQHHALQLHEFNLTMVKMVHANSGNVTYNPNTTHIFALSLTIYNTFTNIPKGPPTKAIPVYYMV